MPSMSDTTRIAASGSQPPFCSWARHNNGMIADCWRPAGYFAICSFAHAAFSAVKENSFGCWSGGATRRLAMIIPVRSSVNFPEHDVDRAQDRRDVGQHVATAEEIHRLQMGEARR